MKIILLHGENSAASYNRLHKFISEAHKRSWEVVRIFDKTKNISEQLVSNSLFGDTRLIVIEDLKLLSKNDLVWLKKRGKDLPDTLILYQAGIVGKTVIKSLPPVDKVEEFKVPLLLWKLLDTFYPGNQKQFLRLLHEVAKKEQIEFIFALLAKQVRDLYWLKKDSKSIPYPSWKISKLKPIALKFNENQLENIISELSIIDVKSKTSDSELIDLLDLLAITYLK